MHEFNSEHELKSYSVCVHFFFFSEYNAFEICISANRSQN